MEDVKLKAAMKKLAEAVLDLITGITAMVVSANAVAYGFNHLLAERLSTGQITATYSFAVLAMYSLAFKSKFMKEHTAMERIKASFASLVISSVVFLATWLAI